MSGADPQVKSVYMKGVFLKKFNHHGNDVGDESPNVRAQKILNKTKKIAQKASEA